MNIPPLYALIPCSTYIAFKFSTEKSSPIYQGGERLDFYLLSSIMRVHKITNCAWWSFTYLRLKKSLSN